MQIQHGISRYLWIWLLLFVLSALSYAIDLMAIEGNLRAVLICALMLMKAGLIMAVFMHLEWERPVLVATVIAPPLCLLVVAALMAIEADYTLWLREVYFWLK